MDFNRRVLPFFMTYPGMGERNEKDSMRDLEYLQQMYPQEVKRYQQRVAQMLDRMDYDGSMIYDEYPDRLVSESADAGGSVLSERAGGSAERSGTAGRMDAAERDGDAADDPNGAEHDGRKVN